jgi:hypothetical protein
MAIYRVFGTGPGGATGSFDIRAESEAAARNLAVREGLVNTTRVELVEGEHSPDDRSMQAPRLMRHDSRDRQREAPVWTIAKGVCLGLLLWTVVCVVAWVGFFVITMLLFSAAP